MAQESWDLIHLRMLCGSIHSWQELYQNIYRYERGLVSDVWLDYSFVKLLDT